MVPGGGAGFKGRDRKARRSVVFIQTRDENRELEYTDEQKARITPYIEEYMSENDEGELTFVCALRARRGKRDGRIRPCRHGGWT